MSDDSSSNSNGRSGVSSSYSSSGTTTTTTKARIDSDACAGFRRGEIGTVTSTFSALCHAHPTATANANAFGCVRYRPIRLTEGAILTVTEVWRSDAAVAGCNPELADIVFDGNRGNFASRGDAVRIYISSDDAERYLEPFAPRPSPSSFSSSLPPMLLGGAPYREVVAALESSGALKFPRDVATRIASFLVVKRVIPIEVTAVGCSSTRWHFPVEITLTDSSNDDFTEGYWITKEGSMPDGIGEEWIEFGFGRTIRRCSYVGISIPSGVSVMNCHSVRRFRVDSSLDGGSTWTVGSTVYETMDLPGIQTFKLSEGKTTANREDDEDEEGGGLDGDRVRLVCLENVHHAYAGEDKSSLPREWYEHVGLFRVRWK